MGGRPPPGPVLPRHVVQKQVWHGRRAACRIGPAKACGPRGGSDMGGKPPPGPALPGQWSRGRPDMEGKPPPRLVLPGRWSRRWDWHGRQAASQTGPARAGGPGGRSGMGGRPGQVVRRWVLHGRPAASRTGPARACRWSRRWVWHGRQAASRTSPARAGGPGGRSGTRGGPHPGPVLPRHVVQKQV